ncbi:MAG: DsbA family protein [Gammaproteobacteria bacterium]|nr:DsbA family protein [Gammaproteobacteria bacterium]
MNKNIMIYAAIFIMSVGFSLAAYFYTTQQQTATTELAASNADALAPAHAMRKGSPDAKVTIVEFFDPACGTCKQFHPVIKELLNKFPTQINVVMRYSPFHQGSDEMVAILEASRKQSQFWNVLDIMFETQDSWVSNHVAHPELFWGYLKGYGIDADRLQQDMQDPKIVDVIQRDLADGETLKVEKTPTFFVNGKPLPSFGFDQFWALVKSELEANY